MIFWKNWPPPWICHFDPSPQKHVILIFETSRCYFETINLHEFINWLKWIKYWIMLNKRHVFFYTLHRHIQRTNIRTNQSHSNETFSPFSTYFVCVRARQIIYFDSWEICKASSFFVRKVENSRWKKLKIAVGKWKMLRYSFLFSINVFYINRNFP